MIIFQCLMAQSQNNIHMSANTIGGRKNSSKRFLWIPSTTPLVFLASGSAKFRLFNECFEKKFHNQLTGEHLTFANINLNSERGKDDSHDDKALLLPLSVEVSMAKDAKGTSKNTYVIPQELPEPDDIAIAHVDNPQAELVRWH